MATIQPELVARFMYESRSICSYSFLSRESAAVRQDLGTGTITEVLYSLALPLFVDYGVKGDKATR